MAKDFLDRPKVDANPVGISTTREQARRGHGGLGTPEYMGRAEQARGERIDARGEV